MHFWRNAYWFITAKRSWIVLFLFIFRRHANTLKRMKKKKIRETIRMVDFKYCMQSAVDALSSGTHCCCSCTPAKNAIFRFCSAAIFEDLKICILLTTNLATPIVCLDAFCLRKVFFFSFFFLHFLAGWLHFCAVSGLCSYRHLHSRMEKPCMSRPYCWFHWRICSFGDSWNL